MKKAAMPIRRREDNNDYKQKIGQQKGAAAVL